MNIFKRERKRLETSLAYLGLAILPRLPRKLILALARLAGRLAFHLAPGQRRITLANLEIAYGPGKSAAEKRQIALAVFQNMTLVFLDYFWFARQPRERVRKYVVLDESLPRYFPAPPAVVVTAHFGNWELLSRGMAAAGYPHVVVSAPLPNPATQAIVKSYRMTNAEMIPVRGAVRGLLRALHQGKYIALLLDQNIKPKDGGIFVDFFGRPVPMSKSAALLALRVNAPITPLFCRTQPDGYYVIYARPPIRRLNDPIEGQDSVQDLTRKIASVYQQEIEKSPEQWMWMYKRWKHIKPGWPASAYPYYAKPVKQAESGKSEPKVS